MLPQARSRSHRSPQYGNLGHAVSVEINHTLEELQDPVIFVGGATVWLYMQRIAEEIRPTDDVDVLIEISDYKAYANLEEKLRSKKFVNDIQSRVICRYKIQGITPLISVLPW